MFVCVRTSLSKCQFLWDSWLYGRLVSSNLQAITPHVYFWNRHERASVFDQLELVVSMTVFLDHRLTQMDERLEYSWV